MIDERAKAGIEAAVKTLETIDEYTETSTSRGPQHWQGVGIRAATHGADFRALRDMLHALDPDNDKNGGALSPISRPEDRRIIYLCPQYVRELDYSYAAGDL